MCTLAESKLPKLQDSTVFSGRHMAPLPKTEKHLHHLKRSCQYHRLEAEDPSPTFSSDSIEACALLTLAMITDNLTTACRRWRSLMVWKVSELA